MPSRLPPEQLSEPASRTPDAVWDLAEVAAVVAAATASLLLCGFSGPPEAVGWYNLEVADALRLADALPSAVDLTRAGFTLVPARGPVIVGGAPMSAVATQPVRGADGTEYGWCVLFFREPRPWSSHDDWIHTRMASQVGAQIDLYQGWRKMAAELHALSVFRTYFQDGPDLLLYLNGRQEVLSMSKGWEDLFGRPLSEFAGEGGRAFIHPDDLPRTASASAALAAGGKPVRGFEYRMRHADGRYLWLRVNAAVISGDIIVSATEVTAEKAREDMLAAIAEARSRFIQGAPAERVLEGVLHSFLTLTGSEYGLIGVTERDPDGSPYLRICEVEGFQLQLLAAAQRNPRSGAIELREPSALIVMASQRTEPWILNHLDAQVPGRWRVPGAPTLGNFLGLPVRTGDQVVGVVALYNCPDGYHPEHAERVAPLLDTVALLLQAIKAEEDRKAFTAALAASEARFRGLFDHAREAKFIVDARGRIEQVNPAVSRMLGYTAEELIGSDLRSLIAPARRARADAGFLVRAQRRFEDEPNRAETTQGLRKDGEQIPVEYSMVALPGDELRFAVVLRDLTERQRVERLKSEFVSVVSHELRTPLTAIRGGLGLLAQDQVVLDEVEREGLLRLALQNSDRLNALIGDILDMEKVSQGRMEFKLRPLEVADAVRESARATAGYAAHYSTTVTLVEPLAAGRACVDDMRLAQVLNNLISNAAKHSPRGAPIEVGLTTDGDVMRIEVRDHGPGVPPAFRSHLFLPFSQADGSDSRARGGTGLGLSIAHAIVEQMAGRLGYQDAPGGGALFWVELPCASLASA